MIKTLLDDSHVHPEWRPILTRALSAVDKDYLASLISDDAWLPGRSMLLSAFQRDLTHCHYILFGESPYPRAASANGIAFFDAAVTDLWSIEKNKGLSKPVNKATSLRNILKTALIAEDILTPNAEQKITQQMIANMPADLKIKLTPTIQSLFKKLAQRGFLLCNATPVLHPNRKPLAESKKWKPFVAQLLIEIAHHCQQASTPLPTLILWGKIAKDIQAMPSSCAFPSISSEHPYNLSFIQNPEMQRLFKQLSLLN